MGVLGSFELPSLGDPVPSFVVSWKEGSLEIKEEKIQVRRGFTVVNIKEDQIVIKAFGKIHTINKEGVITCNELAEEEVKDIEF